MTLAKGIILVFFRIIFFYGIFALLATELNPFEWRAWVRIVFVIIILGVTTVDIHEQIENNDE